MPLELTVPFCSGVVAAAAAAAAAAVCRFVFKDILGPVPWGHANTW